MKAKKFVEELKDKTIAELNVELANKKKELFNYRFQNATNQLENPMVIGEVRRSIAQINTIIKQKEQL